MNPTAYKLETSEGTIDFANGGTVMLSHNKTVTIPGVPVGTRVTVIEDLSGLDAQNHKYTQSGDTGVAGSGDITITNEPTTVQPIYADVPGVKLLDGDFYSGDLFGFVLTGLAPFPGDNDSVVNTLTQKELSAYEVDDGSFKIGDKNTKDATKALKFSKPGIYRYLVREDLTALEEIDDLMGDTAYSSDIVQSDDSPKQYLVEFDVKLQGDNTLKATGPLFFDYDTDDPAAEMVFFNEVRKGSVTIEKADQGGRPALGVTFGVFKLTDEEYAAVKALVDANKQEEAYAYIMDGDAELYDFADTESKVVRDDHGQEYETGYVKFSDLPIYRDGYLTADTIALPEYQQYCLLEMEDATHTYHINKQVHLFSFPTEQQYDVTYEYVNGVLRNPTTAGPGMTLFKVLGWSLAALSVLALCGYAVYTKRFAKRKAVKHFVRK